MCEINPLKESIVLGEVQEMVLLPMSVTEYKEAMLSANISTHSLWPLLTPSFL